MLLAYRGAAHHGPPIGLVAASHRIVYLSDTYPSPELHGSPSPLFGVPCLHWQNPIYSGSIGDADRHLKHRQACVASEPGKARPRFVRNPAAGVEGT